MMRWKKPGWFSRGAGEEFSQLKKWASRHFRDPKPPKTGKKAKVLPLMMMTRRKEATMGQMIYDVWHYQIPAGQSPDVDKEEEESPKFIGTYSSEENAKIAIAALSRQPGFQDWPGGFETSGYPLDSTGWDGGFTTEEEWYEELERGELGSDDD